MIDVNEFEQFGYTIAKQVVSLVDLYYVASDRIVYDHPVRGHDIDGKYYSQPHQHVEWANYWTESLLECQSVMSLSRTILPMICYFIEDPILYHSDVSVVSPGSRLIRPHVDTPHRHAPWNLEIDHCVGVQVAIPIKSYTPDSGLTAFLPGSHRRQWPIKQCYQGKFNDEFLAECVQPQVEYGDAIIWDSRTLHSQMMNTTDTPRYMLLFNYLASSIVSDVVRFESAQ